MERNYAMPANLVQREKILTRPSFRIPPQRAERREDFTLPALFTDGAFCRPSWRCGCGGDAPSTGESPSG